MWQVWLKWILFTGSLIFILFAIIILMSFVSSKENLSLGSAITGHTKKEADFLGPNLGNGFRTRPRIVVKIGGRAINRGEVSVALATTPPRAPRITCHWLIISHAPTPTPDLLPALLPHTPGGTYIIRTSTLIQTHFPYTSHQQALVYRRHYLYLPHERERSDKCTSYALHVNENTLKRDFS